MDPEERLRAFEEALLAAEAEQERQLKKSEAMERELVKMREQVEESVVRRRAGLGPKNNSRTKSAARPESDTQEVDPDA